MQAEASLVAGRGEAVTWEMRERMPFTRSPSSYHHGILIGNIIIITWEMMPFSRTLI